MKHAPRKRFGQHFLTDHSVIAAIVSAIAPRAGERLVEIGPGLGALTVGLLERTERLEAVEIDRDLVARLRHRWPPERLLVHEADALAFDFAALAGPDRLRLVGNLPYNISSPLLIGLLASREVIIDQHFMLQKEVVDRIVAQHGCADYGRLSVMLQAHHHVEQLFDVPPEAFDPPPRVESSVVRLITRAEPLAKDLDSLERGTLMPWLRSQGLDPEDPRFGLEPTARPEDVAVTQWACLADALFALRGAAPAH